MPMIKTTILILILLLSTVAQAKCPEGIYSDPGKDPFYVLNVDRENGVNLVFCGYAGEDKDNTIQTGEYDIFLVNSTGQPINDGEPILAFGAVDETIIDKSAKTPVIKDILGGFTYTFNANILRFEKSFSYKPSKISLETFNDLKSKIKSGQMDYMWPWQVLDAAILGYPGAESLFLGLSKYVSKSAAGSEEYSKTKLVYEAYKQDRTHITK